MKKIIFAIFIMAVVAHSQDIIRGTYSYTYGDKESLVEAKQTCKDLAVKDAIESYYLYVESSTQVENYMIKEDIIKSLAAGFLKNLQVTDEKEEGRTITMTVEAEVNPDEVKQLVQKEVEEKPVAVETANETQPAQPQVDDFAVLLSKYENRVASAERDFDQKQYDRGLSQLQEMDALLTSFQNRAKGPFQTMMLRSISLRNQIDSDFMRFKRNQAQGHPIRERVAGREIKQKIRQLEDNLTRLLNLDKLGEKQKAVRAVWVQNCRHLIDSIHQTIH